MIELVETFKQIAMQMESLLIFKLKQLDYKEALLFIYKNHESIIPSFDSTKYLGTKDWYYAEYNISNFDHIQNEKDMLSYLKQIYHDGAPQDITKCALT